MKIQVILIDEENGKWGWIVRGDDFNGGGDETADTKPDAEQQAKKLVGVLIKTEKVNMDTDSILLSETTRTQVVMDRANLEKHMRI